MGQDKNEDEEAGEPRHIGRIIDDIHSRIIDRERGLFTKTDREFLLGRKEYDYEQSAINKRRDIRNRLEDGILDLQLLPYIAASERSKFFDNFDKGELHESIARLMVFLYSGLDGNTEAIEQMIESGIFKAERGGVEGFEGGARDVEVSIELTLEYDVDEIYQRFKRGYGDDLTPAEIGVLVREGRLSPEDYEDLSWEAGERPRNTPATPTDQWYRFEDSE